MVPSFIICSVGRRLSLLQQQSFRLFSGLPCVVVPKSPFQKQHPKEQLQTFTTSSKGGSSNKNNTKDTGSTSKNTEDNNVNTTKSKRQQFKDIPVHPSILNYVKVIGVGIPPPRGRRRRGSRSNDFSPFLMRRGGRGAKKSTATEAADGAIDTTRGPATNHMLPPKPFGRHSRVRIVTNGTTKKINNKHSSTGSNHRTPEVAIAGRSNVGKSTLLNALLYGNKYLPDDSTNNSSRKTKTRRRGRTPETAKLPRGAKASVSDKPGETRCITFYQLSSSSQSPSSQQSGDNSSSNQQQKPRYRNPKLRLVDLPGYGFAYASPEESNNFQTVMRDYILYRGKALKRLLLLIDARHGMKKADFDFLDMLQRPPTAEQGDRQEGQASLPPIQIVLTKCDLVNQMDLCRRCSQVREQLSDSLFREPSQLPVLFVSARAGLLGGILELQKELAALVPRQSPKAG